MYVDNSGAVELSKERRSCQERSRHVDQRDLKVREYVAHGNIEVRKIGTDYNVADVYEVAANRRASQTCEDGARHLSREPIRSCGEPAPLSLSVASEH
eukprot:1400700-Pleurochrysis_carterae.AAC.1